MGVVMAAVSVAMSGLVLDLPTAAATSIGTLSARAAAIESRLASENALLAADATAYLAERARYVSSVAAEGKTRSRVHAIERVVASDRTLVRSAALTTYIEAGASSPIGLYLEGKPDQLALGEEYVRAATDTITSSIDALTSEETSLASNIKIEQTQTDQAAAALSATTAARASVLQGFNAEHALLASVNGQLATLVRQAEIAREQAAARAAAASAAATGPPSVSGTAPVTISTAVPSSLSSAFAAIRRCESSDDYALDTGNGYYGAYQFAASTWTRLGESGLASEASPATQDAAAYKLYQSSGWGAWPECAAAAGL
jgi:hypothetical protein